MGFYTIGALIIRIRVPLKGSFKGSLKGSIGSIGFRDVQGFGLGV